MGRVARPPAAAESAGCVALCAAPRSWRRQEDHILGEKQHSSIGAPGSKVHEEIERRKGKKEMREKETNNTKQNWSFRFQCFNGGLTEVMSRQVAGCEVMMMWRWSSGRVMARRSPGRENSDKRIIWICMVKESPI